MDKRPRLSDRSPRVSKRDYHHHSNVYALLESLLTVSDSALIDASFDVAVESRSTDSDQNAIIQRAIHLGSVLLEAGKRSDRKRSSVHNASVWPLPADLTIKVFSMLDTPSVSSAAATCSFFQNCAADPLCYVNIDFTLVPNVNDYEVSTMIQRAGNALQSIKLGVLPHASIRNFADASKFPRNILTGSCLSFLSANGGVRGSRLRRLHLFNIEEIDNTTLLASLSVCPSLVDLEIVRLDVDINHVLESVSRHCRSIECFIYENWAGDDLLEASTCKNFVLNCPKITTLALKACRLQDSEAHKLVKGFHALKYVDFAESGGFTGAFLKNLGTKGGGNNLEAMILRDCNSLNKVEVKKFMKALLAGKFRLLRYLDISNSDGLAYNGDYHHRGYGGSSLLSFLCEIVSRNLLKQRPNFCLVAEFPNKRESNTLDPVEVLRRMFRPRFEHMW